MTDRGNTEGARPVIILLLIAFSLAAIVFVLLISLEGRGVGHDELVGETGIVERSSALLWFIASFLLLIGPRRRFASRLEPVALAYLNALLGLRELDAHKRIFEWNLSKFYNLLKPSIPLAERLIAIGLIFLPLLLVLYLVWRIRMRNLRRDTVARKPWAVYTIGWFIFAVLAYLVDKITWISKIFGSEVFTSFASRALEESLELSLAAYTLTGVFLTWREIGPNLSDVARFDPE